MLLSVVKVQEFGERSSFTYSKIAWCWWERIEEMHCRLELRDHSCPAPTSRAVMQPLGGSRTGILCMQTLAPVFAMSIQGVLGPRDSVPSLGQESEVGHENSCFEDG